MQRFKFVLILQSGDVSKARRPGDRYTRTPVAGHGLPQSCRGSHKQDTVSPSAKPFQWLLASGNRSFFLFPTLIF